MSFMISMCVLCLIGCCNWGNIVLGKSISELLNGTLGVEPLFAMFVNRVSAEGRLVVPILGGFGY